MNLTKLSVRHTIYATPLLVTEENLARLRIIYGTYVFNVKYGITKGWWLAYLAAYLRAQLLSQREQTCTPMNICFH